MTKVGILLITTEIGRVSLGKYTLPKILALLTKVLEVSFKQVAK